MVIPEASPATRIGLFSAGMQRIPGLAQLLEAELVAHSWRGFPKPVDAIAGWGAKPTARRARAYAAHHGLPYWAVEDGFIRSYGTGEHFPPLALVVDHTGIYYDSTRPSALETLLASDTDVLADGIGEQGARAQALLLAHRLSKYNQALMRLPEGFDQPAKRILLVDQTRGDMSVQLGGADAHSFAAMLAAARAEHPDAQLVVKTHPEVSSGRKAGYFGDLQPQPWLRLLCEPVNPFVLLEQIDQVYVVSSTLGFEALLAGKPVTVFGRPWYAGWGLTDDRQPMPRRPCSRRLDELFAAAYLHYSRYLNPATHERGTLFDVIDWLIDQQTAVARLPQRLIGVGLRRWKAVHLHPILNMVPQGVYYVHNAQAAQHLTPGPEDGLIHWGRDAPAGLPELAAASGARLLHLEDGFYRSVGLGSDLIRPRSLVIDAQGLYFDPRTPSDLETLLNTAEFSAADCERAERIRAFILSHGLTKYNLECPDPPNWPAQGRSILLVPGQVEDDASVRYGCTQINTNLALLAAVRAAHPQAFIVYKPHPDVLSGNRRGRLALSAARRYADWIENQASPVACLAAADAVHTMTSLTGFEALLRHLPVTVYGHPFYAGWGLTQDQLPIPRRTRSLTLNELIAGVLLRYPLYWDWRLHGFTTCEAVLKQLVADRDRWAASGQLSRLKDGWWSRQGRKLFVLAQTVRGDASRVP